MNRLVYVDVPREVFRDLEEVADDLGISIAALCRAIIVGELTTFKELNSAGADNNK